LIPVLVNFRYNRVEKGKNLGGAKEKARKEENRKKCCQGRSKLSRLA